MSCSLRNTARRCCLGTSGSTWEPYSTILLGARNARLIPPKYSVAEVIGYLKGKSSIWIAQNVERKARNFLGHKFWARGYFVSTVGRNEEMIRTYIKNQEMADKQMDQLHLKLETP
jgi:putative transposase